MKKIMKTIVLQLILTAILCLLTVFIIGQIDFVTSVIPGWHLNLRWEAWKTWFLLGCYVIFLFLILRNILGRFNLK
jgi:hypothetical protein